MRALYSGIMAISISITACKNETARIVDTVRDKTISENNAFSDLFMDSTTLEKYISTQNVEDTLAARLRNFYNARNYHFAWFSKEGLAEQTHAFWNLHNSYVEVSNDTSFTDKRLHQQMMLLINEDTSGVFSNVHIVQTELQLTEHFFQYAKYAYVGKVDPEGLQWHIPRKKVDAMALLDSLIANKGKNIEAWEPVHPQYNLMISRLTLYNNIQKNGGWEEIVLSGRKSYKAGDSALLIKEIKQRLASVGDYKGNDTTEVFSEELKVAVMQAQKRFGYKQNGIIDAAIINSLNVPAKQRIQQMLVNMERMRWMPKEPKGSRLVANIPDFKLNVFEDSEKVFEMDIVVGTSANRTVIFNDLLKYVVFSPYWNIPRSIVRNEILPAMQRDSRYLSRMNMEQTGFSNGLPVVRQKPGGKNALGKVKFIFPNSYSIYFHDTPAKSLFGREKRAFSHGCIRLAEPRKLAEYLLRNQPEWTAKKIKDAMNASKEKWVTLKDPVPVIITYFTCWVNEDGLLNFREDIYGRDQKLAERLFESRS
jgi:murein L,D-transpeptidase YcbB/YkuD